MRQAAFELIEVINIGEKLADDQHGPAVGKDLSRACDRAILAIEVHIFKVARIANAK